jgi:hypothetical protein
MQITKLLINLEILKRIRGTQEFVAELIHFSGTTNFRDFS